MNSLDVNVNQATENNLALHTLLLEDNLTISFFMTKEKEFDAETFTAKLRLGEFDGNLEEAVRKLSTPQLEQVADILMAKQSTETHWRDGPYGRR